MILDERNTFAKGEAIPTSAGTAVLGDVIDLEVSRDIGNGRPVYWFVTVDEAGEDGTSLQVQLVSSAAEALSAPNIHLQTAVVPVADLTEGKMLIMASLPLEGPTYLRYLGIRTVVAGNFTAGSIESGLTLDPKGWRAYPEGDS